MDIPGGIGHRIDVWQMGHRGGLAMFCKNCGKQVDERAAICVLIAAARYR